MFHPEHDEVGHYFRFQAIKLGRCYRRGDTVASGPSGHLISVDWEGVRPMQPNPRGRRPAVGSELRKTSSTSRTARSCNSWTRRSTATRRGFKLAIGAMFRLRDQANALMQFPTDDGLATAGPTFEYVARGPVPGMSRDATVRAHVARPFRE